MADIFPWTVFPLNTIIFQLFSRFEGQGQGVQWSNIFKGVTVDDDFVFGHVLLMFAVDGVIYSIFTWYIDGIFPGEYGIPKKWYFPFMRKYWCGIQEKVRMFCEESIAQTPKFCILSLYTNENAFIRFHFYSFVKKALLL